MNTDEFWQLIDTVHRDSRGDMDRKCELLKIRLEAMDEPELQSFDHHFSTMNAAAYTWPLWGAAYVMEGGCSDDAFIDFRATLISQGRAVYERALADPDSLADVDYDEDGPCYEGFQYVAQEVADEKSTSLSESSVPHPADPAGKEWDEDDLAALYPRLTEKYGMGGKPDNGGKATDSPAPGKPWWKFW